MVYLVGFMGCGKSAVGRVLARELERPFVDSDERIAEREGRSIEEVFRESGEAHFRALERELLREIDPREAPVVATGGGAFVDERTRRRLLATGHTVWLDVDLDVARRRVGAGDGRPLWSAGDPAALRELYERRSTVYALAEYRVDASPDDPRLVARRILDLLPAD